MSMFIVVCYVGGCVVLLGGFTPGCLDTLTGHLYIAFTSWAKHRVYLLYLKLTIGNKNKEKCTNKKKEYFEMSFFVLYFHVQSYEPGER